MSEGSSSSQECVSSRTYKCGLTALYLMAYTHWNAGRRFYKCPKPEKNLCDYFEWANEVLSDKAIIIICKLKAKLETVKIERLKLKEKLEALEAINDVEGKN
nr:uncharacterized protein LOC104101736 [Nicotiana tomentosiformis]